MGEEKKLELTESSWKLLDKTQKDAEKITRPGLTFLQDGWRRLRGDWVAMISMIFVLVLIVIAVVVPSFWRYSYADQNLNYSNIPPRMTIYEVKEGRWVYITSDYTALEVSEKGELLGQVTAGRKDAVNRKNYYVIDDQPMIIDFSAYNAAKVEYNKLSKMDTADEELKVKDAKYLLANLGQDQAEEEISIEEAYRILENEVPRWSVTLDGKEPLGHKKVWNKTYIFGTDGLGRDIFIRIVYGARISLAVALVAALVNLVIGVLYGAIAGYIGGRTDNIMMRFVDIINSIPMMLYVILLTVMLGGGGLGAIIIALGLTYWVRMARIVRGQVLSLRQQEFVLAAKTLGADTKRILLKHLVPNMMGPIMVALAMQIPNAIFTEAFLSFIGLGISAPQASWGTLCNDALPSLYINPYQMVIPAVAISLTILAFNLFSDGLRDAFDPKQRK